MSIFDLIRDVKKYEPIANFMIAHSRQVVDLAATGQKAIVAIETTDPTIIPHLEELTADLVKAAGAPPVQPGLRTTDPHVTAKHIVAKALVHPTTLSASEKAWMDRASQSGGQS